MIAIAIKGLEEAQRKLHGIARDTGSALVRALNTAIKGARTEASAAIRKQVALKKAYVDEKLRLKLASRPEDPVAKLTAERRGVLLSRFSFAPRMVRGKTVAKKPGGIRITVKPGKRKLMASAFLVPLRRGREDGGNGVGIAIRKYGENRKFDVLHGPSVSQVFSTVRQDVTPDVLDRYRREFDRQMKFILTR